MSRKHDRSFRYYGVGATPGNPVSANRQIVPTVTGQVGGLVNLAAKPVRWAFHTAGGLVKWVGSTLDTIGNKL